MKKFLSGIISSLILASMTVGISASAETVAEPNFALNGNKCGMVVVDSQIERDVEVTITQHSPDGDYDYYTTVIPASEKDRVFNFVLEGKDDVNYIVKLGVAKYNGSDLLQYVTDEECMIYDTDEIKEQNVAGYRYKYTVLEGKELKKDKTLDNKKDKENIFVTESNVYFPIADYIRGDVNLNGKLDLQDAIAVAKHRIKNPELTDPIKLEIADYDQNGKVDLQDIIAISKAINDRK